MNRTAQTIGVTLTGILFAGRVVLIDRDGRPLTKPLPAWRLGEAGPDAVLAWQWKCVTKQMTQALDDRAVRHAAGPWVRRANALAASFRLRQLDGRPRSKRRRFQRYATTTWEEASLRLSEQGRNAARRHDREGWVRWSHTASNNQNKRVDAYAQRKHHHSQAGA